MTEKAHQCGKEVEIIARWTSKNGAKKCMVECIFCGRQYVVSEEQGSVRIKSVQRIEWWRAGEGSSRDNHAGVTPVLRAPKRRFNPANWDNEERSCIRRPVEELVFALLD